MTGKEEIEYDNKYRCPKCGGSNDLSVTDTINQHISECKTQCKDCGHQNYWAYGFFEQEF